MFPTRFFLLVLLALPLPALADTVGDWCAQLGKRLRSVSAQSCRNLPFATAEDRTVKGNALAWLDVEPTRTVETTEPARRIMVIGGIHGDELTSVSIVFRWLESIRDPEAAGHRWRLIPAANPDGLLARPSTRVNANGIDLNRNFPTPDWERDARDYWVRRAQRDPRRNPGEKAGSEVETRWLQAQIDTFRPDLIVSVHAPYNLLDYDGPVPEPMRFGRLALYRLGVYPGSLGNYSGLHKLIPVVTIELPYAGIMPGQREEQAIWRDMLRWIDHNIKPAAPPDAGQKAQAHETP